jgi:hypothetical protein
LVPERESILALCPSNVSSHSRLNAAKLKIQRVRVTIVVVIWDVIKISPGTFDDSM